MEFPIVVHFIIVIGFVDDYDTITFVRWYLKLVFKMLSSLTEKMKLGGE